MKLEAFSTLTASFYDAAHNLELWPSLARDAAHAFGVESCLMQVQDRVTKSASLLGFTPNLTSKAMADYREYFYAEDWWATTALHAGIGSAVICSDFFNEAELVNTQFYHDWVAAHDIHDALAGTMRVQRGEMAIMGIHRARRMPPFTAKDKHAMRLVMGHYCKAIELTRRLSILRRGQILAFDAMDSLAAGVVIVDRTSKILIANKTAESIIKAADGLVSHHDRLAASDIETDRSLQKTIRMAILSVRGMAALPPDIVVVPRTEGRPITVNILPLPPEAVGAGSIEPMAMIFISGRDQANGHWSEALKKAYGLTHAEAKLAAALIRGVHLQEYCEKAEISINTGRTQLRGLLAKTDCNRQADFIRQVLSDPVIRMAANSDV